MGEKKIAFIGTGVMGASVVKHLIASHYSVIVYTRTKGKAEPLIEVGAQWAETVGDAVKHADLVFTMVGYPVDVEEVYFGDNGILANGKAGLRHLTFLNTHFPFLVV